jgi:hypothetical protein
MKSLMSSPRLNWKIGKSEKKNDLLFYNIKFEPIYVAM